MKPVLAICSEHNAGAAVLVGRQQHPVTSAELAQRLNVSRMRSLMESAAGVVLRNSSVRTPATLPARLNNMLDDWPICVCGKLCKYTDVMIFHLKSDRLPTDAHDVLYYAAFCSRMCLEECCVKILGRQNSIIPQTQTYHNV